jgi:tetratricopeptide (TPR) repeat protein
VDRPSTVHHWFFRNFGACLLIFSFAAPLLQANDIIILRTSDGNSERRVSGSVLDYSGRELLLQHASGREERLPASRVVRVDGAWSESHRKANERFAAGDYEAAEALYLQAFGEEMRPWVKRRVRARLTWCYRYIEQPEKAAKAFVPIYREDPQTPHFSAIPLVWATGPPNPTLESQTRSWMSDRSPSVARLIGASWSLSSANRGEAIRTLQSLANDEDVRVVFLAEAQIWRTREATTNEQERERWQERIQDMPSSIRGGPLFVLGRVLSRQKQHERAALTFMKTAVLYPAERDLTCHALLAAARELETIERTQEATGLYREILVDHATSQVSAEAELRLKELMGRDEM